MPRRKPARHPIVAYRTPDQEDEQRECLRLLRRAALEVMRLLDAFHPYLIGAVLDGTADRFSEANIHLFADSAKDVEIFLLSVGISYEPAETGRKGPDAPEARLRMDWDGVPVVLSVYPYVAERQSRRSPHSGHGPARARAEAVAALLENPGA